MKSSVFSWMAIVSFFLCGELSVAQTNSSNKTKEEKVDSTTWLDYDSLFLRFFSQLDTSLFNTDSFPDFSKHFKLDGAFDSGGFYQEMVKSMEGMGESFEHFFKENETIEDIDEILKEQFQGFLNKDSIDQYDKLIQEQIKNFSDFFNSEEDSISSPE